jgi:hypothetical protein
MMAILHGNKHGSSSRGDRVPESIARKYEKEKKSVKYDDLPDSKGKEHQGGLWTTEHHKKHAKKSKLKKSEQIQPVVDKLDRILLKVNEIGEYSLTNEYKDNDFVSLDQIPWEKLDSSSVVGIEAYLSNILNKSEIKPLKIMMAQSKAFEVLSKNIIRTDGPADTVYSADHGDAIRHVKSSTFKFLRNATKDMTDESIKEIKLGSLYTINIRKHVNDVYSGKVTNGQKVIHHFETKSLPSVALDLMSLFEWYSPEDEQELENLQDFPDEYSEEFLHNITKDYEKNNLGQIYTEMETIRQEIRNEVSIDIIQVEQRIMKLFDKLQELMLDIGIKHNTLTEISESEIEQIQNKLLTLQSKLEEMEKKPVNVDAYVPNPNSQNKVHDAFYPYLPKPQITIHPSGKVTISFGQEWTDIERENFLQDMKAKVIGSK